MGEIKSSIELAMERTRHLAPSGEDRGGLSERERRDRALPLVRRLLHGDLDPGALSGAVEALQHAQPQEDWADVVARECARALVPAENDVLILSALKPLACAWVEDLLAALDDTKQGLQAATEAARIQRGKDLQKEGIAGSAVLPNPCAAPQWRAQREELLAGFAATRDELLRRGR